MARDGLAAPAESRVTAVTLVGSLRPQELAALAGSLTLMVVPPAAGELELVAAEGDLASLPLTSRRTRRAVSTWGRAGARPGALAAQQDSNDARVRHRQRARRDDDGPGYRGLHHVVPVQPPVPPPVPPPPVPPHHLPVPRSTARSRRREGRGRPRSRSRCSRRIRPGRRACRGCEQAVTRVEQHVGSFAPSGVVAGAAG